MLIAFFWYYCTTRNEDVEIYLHILLKADEPKAGVHAAVYGESVFIAVRPVRVDPRAADFSRLLENGESEAICVVAEIANTAEPRGTSSNYSNSQREPL